jgi:hypothetical protein
LNGLGFLLPDRRRPAVNHCGFRALLHLREVTHKTKHVKSCFLTLCEGLPNDGVAMRRKYFTESRNSLHEVVGAMDLAHAIGAVDGDMASEVQELAVRLRRMLGALLR